MDSCVAAVGPSRGEAIGFERDTRRTGGVFAPHTSTPAATQSPDEGLMKTLNILASPLAESSPSPARSPQAALSGERQLFFEELIWSTLL